MSCGGPEWKKLDEAVFRDTGQHTKAFLTRPTLRADCIEYFDAYRSLGVCRTWTEAGAEPIQISEIEAFLNLAGIEGPDLRLKYMRLIKRMDLVELKHIQSKRKKK